MAATVPGQDLPDSTQDASPGDGRDETTNERSDRNWEDILQELRVTQTGTQIISGFLLTLAFQQRFTHLSSGLLGLYIALVVLAAVTTALGLAPVSLHRTLFRQHAKPRMVAVASALLMTNLLLVALLTGGVVVLIVSFALDLAAGITAGTAIFVVLALLLVVLPSVARGSGRPSGDAPS
ncbi:MAG: sodium:proton antiporter [Microbacteriaceae bacterium]|nr:sodium:proton antiporter [Microbacteriaceae bacterium]